MSENELTIDTLGINIQAARQTVKELFEIVGITQAIIIDDDWTSAMPDEAVFVIASDIHSSGDIQALRAVPEFAGIQFDLPIEAWREKFLESLAPLASGTKARIYQSLGKPMEGEAQAKGTLEALLADFSPKFISFTEWKIEKDKFLDIPTNQGTLFLFDQNLQKDGGNIDEGMRIIASLLKSEKYSKQGFYFVLFSNTILESTEHQMLEEFAEKYELIEQKNKFALLSKEHLHSKPISFPTELKRVVINPICEHLKEKVYTSIETTIQTAKSKINELNIYDFEQIVFQSSYAEGIWEPDTLLRIFGLYHREAARLCAQKDQTIHELANKVRSVIGIEFRPLDAPERRASEIQRLEWYEKAEYLIDHRMPLDAGDVFQKTGSKSQFILLAQPCSLMVRGDSGKRESGLEFVNLSEIVYYQKDKRLSDSFIELPLYSEEPLKNAYVNLNHTFSAPLFILDLSVFNSNGICALNLKDTCPVGVNHAWKLKFDHISTEAKNRVTRFQNAKSEKVEGEFNSIIQKSLAQSVNGLTQGKISKDKIEYDLKRVGRVKQPRAGGILREFAYFSSRDAFEHDLTRPYPPHRNPPLPTPHELSPVQVVGQ